jgi:hypothetical protein
MVMDIVTLTPRPLFRLGFIPVGARRLVPVLSIKRVFIRHVSFDKIRFEGEFTPKQKRKQTFVRFRFEFFAAAYFCF